MNVKEHKYYEIEPDKQANYVTKYKDGDDILTYVGIQKAFVSEEEDLSEYREITTRKHNSYMRMLNAKLDEIHANDASTDVSTKIDTVE